MLRARTVAFKHDLCAIGREGAANIDTRRIGKPPCAPASDGNLINIGIARNRLYLYYRRTASHQRKLGELKMRILDDLVDNGREETMRRDQIVRLRDCINQLPDRATELIRKRYFENVAVNDVAEQLNSTAAAISCSLHRIRKQLKLCLKEAMG